MKANGLKKKHKKLYKKCFLPTVSNQPRQQVKPGLTNYFKVQGKTQLALFIKKLILISGRLLGCCGQTGLCWILCIFTGREAAGI